MRPARALALLRLTVGTFFLLRTTPILLPLGFRFAQAPLAGWPARGWHLAAFGLALPAWTVAALAILRTVAAASFLAGFHARKAGVIAAAFGWVVLAQDALAYVNSIHLLYLSTLLVALADSSAELALRPEPAASMRSSVWLLRALPMSVYAFAGLAKLNGEFLSGRALLAFREDGFVRGLIAPLACATPARAQAASVFVVIVELALPVLLALPRTRKLAVGIALVFHATLEVSMHPDVFGWLMIALLLPFVATDSGADGVKEAVVRADVDGAVRADRG